MRNIAQTTTSEGVAVEIGGMPILLRTHDSLFRQLLIDRYAGFVSASESPQFQFDIELFEPSRELGGDDDVQVRMQGDQWLFQRGDFRAQWDPRQRCGRIFQSANPYAVDSVLRIVHSLILARDGGFLVHAASAIRAGRAFLFAGISGAGKTTISRLAPADATLLTDEISYVRPDPAGYQACGTPFAGELARVGENQSAPVGELFLLNQGPQNRIEPLAKLEAVRLLLRNILFFADDAELVKLVFQSACGFVDRVPVRRLTFVPDQRVWEMIGTERAA